nr:hypothetical protein [Ardenticatena sp.]
METILTYVEQYDWLIYIVGILGVLLYLNMGRLAWQESRYSIFSLEREERRRDAQRAFMIAGMFAALVLTTAYIDTVVLRPVTPTGELPVVGIVLSPTPTPPIIGPTLTPVPTPTPTRESTPTPSRIAQVLASPTPQATPTPSPTPPATPTPQVVPPNCPNPGVRILSPGMNQSVSGNVAIIGTANIPNFQFYKVEFAPGEQPADSAWSVIGDVVRQPVENGVLATWPAGAFPAGTYWLRLTVVDITGNFPPPCAVRVIVPAVP